MIFNVFRSSSNWKLFCTQRFKLSYSVVFSILICSGQLHEWKDLRFCIYHTLKLKTKKNHWPDAWGVQRLRGTRREGHRLRRIRLCTFRNRCPLQELLRRRRTYWLIKSAKNSHKVKLSLCSTVLFQKNCGRDPEVQPFKYSSIACMRATQISSHKRHSRSLIWKTIPWVSFTYWPSSV